MSESLVARNEKFLSDSALGDIMLDAYDAALEIDPRLRRVLVLPMWPGMNARTIGAARPGWYPQQEGIDHKGLHQIGIPIGESAGVLEFISDSTRRDPTSFQIMSQRLGLTLQTASSRLLGVFGFLHELGHVSQFFDHEESPSAFTRIVADERRKLPYVYAPPSALATEGTPARLRVEAEWEEIKNRLAIDSIEELVRLQAVAYRDMPNEASADYFAAEVFADNPDLTQMLLAGS